MRNHFFVAAALLLFSGCGGEEPAPVKKTDWNTRKSTQLNKELAIQEDIDIKLFLAQHESWKVEQTGSGLRIVRLKDGEGEYPRSGQDAKVSLVVSLLDGTEVYRTPEDEVEVIRIDESDVETGLQEGLKKIRKGGKSKLIVPSHLAHGLVGDLDKIPPLSTLIVDVELYDIK
jgi:FKBP-type peptidyl-prolyl cis-trans isomerase FkpA